MDPSWVVLGCLRDVSITLTTNDVIRVSNSRIRRLVRFPDEFSILGISFSG